MPLSGDAQLLALGPCPHTWDAKGHVPKEGCAAKVCSGKAQRRVCVGAAPRVEVPALPAGAVGLESCRYSRDQLAQFRQFPGFPWRKGRVPAQPARPKGPLTGTLSVGEVEKGAEAKTQLEIQPFQHLMWLQSSAESRGEQHAGPGPALCSTNRSEKPDQQN